MGILALTHAILLAGAPAGFGAVPTITAFAEDAQVAGQAAPIAGEGVVPPPPPLPPPLPAAPPAPLTVPAPDATGVTAADSTDIVVTGRPRNVPGDPLQQVNAKTYAVVQAVDDAVVGPVARAYEKTIPTPIRDGFRNFFNNLHEPIIALNFLLQLKPGKAAETLGRLAINSTLGGAGLFDFAKRRTFKLPRRRNGFANTLGYYGVGPGPFLFLPFIGPTTLRDALGGTLDGFGLPFLIGAPFNKPAYTIPTGINRGLDRRAELDEKIKETRAASDPYATTRTSYLKRRQAEIERLHGRQGDDGTAVPSSPTPTPPVEPPR